MSERKLSGKIANYEKFTTDIKGLYDLILGKRAEFIEDELKDFPDISKKVNADGLSCFFAREVFIVAVSPVHIEGVDGTEIIAWFSFNRDFGSLNTMFYEPTSRRES